jgi:hypothetical protein
MKKEIYHIILAIIILTIVIGFESFLTTDLSTLGLPLLFAALIILANVGGKKITGRNLDCNVENETWMWGRYGLKPNWHLKKEIPLGVIVPLFFTAISLGLIKFMTFLTYEASPMKRRAARRFGARSFTEITDWHNALIGAGGIVAVLLLSAISYFIPFLDGLPKYAAFYAFWNLIPFSKLDGTQILFGSKPLWTALAVITIIFVAGSFLIA